MKIETRNVGRVLGEVGSWRALLLYGEDSGLIRERAQQAARSVAGDLKDPFRVACLEGEEQNRLEEEATALSLTGGRRVVWVREAQDSLVPQLERVLKGESDTLIILEAAGLTPRSKLRSFAEKNKAVAAIGCYPEEGRALSQTISSALAQEKISLSREAMTWLLAHLGSDRSLVRGELEKLSLYGRPGEQLELEDVRNCIGDSAGSTMEEAVHAALAGQRERADQALERAFADGASPIAFTRVVLNVLERLQLASLHVQAGQSRQEAISALRPPVFFRRREMFLRALERWSGEGLQRAAAATQALELACKQSGAPDILLCQRHLARLGRAV
ncbi:DNA polymerase III subunit delta [Oecophyllibacter saccharovorans]|uniref:DNA polymerase III subunit delta n=1 Tax=Oecophyllibacter saccharovorans TaxID=2558360 RepID=UPI00116E2A80|nr:DNA polymerase III subunit delta [Oecophyllibacter saccharovorans]TPW35029.1 DNA polymerase III subunit delta [Oecophyllibacter saccharovorans]